jgi:hypothetical protein
MALDLMVNGWEIGFSRDVLVAELERAGESDMAFNVSFTYDAAEAAAMLKEEFDRIVSDWKGTENGLKFVRRFAEKF